jgi:hypothetical protein
MEVAFWAGTGLALYHGDALLASLILSFWVVRQDGIPVPAEIAFWILAAALIEASHGGEDVVFALVAPVAAARLFYLLILLQMRRAGWRWQHYFLGPGMYPGWSAAAYWWRQRGRAAHLAAWALVLAGGLAWTLGILRWASTWDSWWRLPYVALFLAYALWWCGLGVREARRRVRPRAEEDPAAEAPGAPADWKWQSQRIFTEATSWEETGLPPAILDFLTGFDGPGDRRLRAFAADCAEHVLPDREDAIRKAHALVTTAIEHARERGDGELRGWRLKTAFGGAGSTLTTTTDNLTHERGDPATLELVDDAAAAAYCAVCAPTPLDAATSAANCASVTADGALRDGEHRWQLQRLNRYRREGANPA